ncbi:MAG: hypothetical protein ACLFRI_03545 [Candidatus Izemoplasmataceae bacterium]
MKKLLIFLIAIVLIVGISIQVITSMIHEEVVKEDLPQTVYQDNDTYEGAQNALEDFFSVGDEDDYSNLELFMNYMIYDSIKENINENYDPLSECDSDDCRYIFPHDQGRVEYAYVVLNDEDQLVLTISLTRDAYPSFKTAIHLIFDVEVSIPDTSFILTLDEALIADRTISERTLDTIFNYLDKEAIEDSITYGELDLDEYTFTVSLVTISLF